MASRRALVSATRSEPGRAEKKSASPLDRIPVPAAAAQVACGCVAFGLQQHDRVNIIGFNSPEWVMAQMGTTLAGGAAAGVYTSNEAASCKYVASHSDARIVFVEDAKQLSKYLTFRDELPALSALDSLYLASNTALSPLASTFIALLALLDDFSSSRRACPE